MSSWDEIKTEVERNGNVKTTTMERLRDAHGAAKLGVTVREEISKELAGMGLGHIPEILPSYQDELVRVYKKGTPVGDIIDTVLKPGEQNDQKLALKATNGAADHAATIAKIRELVTA